MISIDLAADLVDCSIANMSVTTTRVATGKWVVEVVSCVCYDFRGLSIFPSRVLVTFDCCCTKWWVLSNGVAVETWKMVHVSFVESFVSVEMDGACNAACMNAKMLLGMVEFCFKALD